MTINGDPWVNLNTNSAGENTMNAQIITLENIDDFEGLLPANFIEETKKRRSQLHTNRTKARQSLQVIDSHRDSLGSEFTSLQGSFRNTSASYSRLAQANKANFTSYTHLGSELKDLSQKLRECAKTIEQFCQ